MSVRLFVGNLSYDVSEADLRNIFGEVGAVTQVRIPLDRESGRPRGFAFVDMADRPHADEAIRRLHQQPLMGRALAVSEAVAREDQRAAPGGWSPRPAGPPPTGGPPSERSERSDRPAGPAPARNFGPDALPRSRRKPEGRGQNAGPKGPIKERASGRRSGGGEDDGEADEVPFWAIHDGKDGDDE